VSVKAIKNMIPLKAISILSRLPLFQQLTPAEKQHIAESNSLFHHISNAETFIKEGEVDDSFYVLLSGHAVVIHAETELTTIEAGDFVGETGFIGNNRRMASVVAKSDIIALHFTRKSFQLLPIRAREVIKDHIIEGLVIRVGELNKRVISEIKAHQEQLVQADQHHDKKPKKNHNSS
jgi:CRP-like cAMP-binding protein